MFFSISPFSLPLAKKVFMPKIDPFEGLFGVFADSLPDGWGRLLVDRLMRRNGLNPQTIGSLERLAIVGTSGMGALTYRPVITMGNAHDKLTLDEIAGECERVLNTESSNNLDYLFAKGGSSGGARPKILTRVQDEDWIIKFPSSDDSKDIGKQEYDYALCARECGLQMEEVSYSNFLGGEHATTVNGNGANPGMEDLLAVAKWVGLNTIKAKKTASEIKDCVFEMLGDYI